MSDLIRKLGSTSNIIPVWLADSSSAVGAGLSGLTSGSSGLLAYFHRDTDTTATQIVLTSMTSGTFTPSGFVEVDATHMKGEYQVGVPDTAFATGAKSVTIYIYGAANLAPKRLLIDLDAQVDVTSWNGTAVPSPATAGVPDTNVKNINNVAAATPGASGGILISGSNAGTTTLAALTVTAATTLTGNVSMAAGLNITQSSSNTSALVITGNGTGHGALITSGSGATGDGIKAVAASTNGNGWNGVGTGSGFPMALTMAGSIWDVTRSAHTTAGTFGGDTVTPPTNWSNEKISVGGYVAIDWANINAPTTTVDLSGTTIGGVDGTTFPATFPTAASITTAVLTTQMTESYSALHTVPTLAQLLFGVQALLTENNVTGLTVTTRKVNGSTTAETFTIDVNPNPTNITRAS